MRYELPEKVRTLAPYQPVCGGYPIRLDANESSLPFPQELADELGRRIAAANLNRYPDPFAAECCALMAARCGVAPEQVLAGNGSDELLGLICGSLLARGGKLAGLEPDFSMYRFYAHLSEVSYLPVSKNQSLMIDVERTAEEVERNGADLLLFSNPCNPTSLLLEPDQVERLLCATGALVVVDEAYMEFADASAVGLVNRYENLLVLRTCSKAAGLAGARMGFAIGPKALIDALKAAKSPYNVSTLDQAAAAGILGAPGYIEKSAARLRTYAQDLYAGLQSLQKIYPGKIRKVYPTKTNFVYMEIEQASAVLEALKEQGIVVRAMPGALRISTGVPEENEALLTALKRILAAGR